MLGRIALRMATVEALKGKTLVGENVLDSEIGALDVAANGSLRSDQEKPWIAVYTDAAKIEGRLDLRELHRSGPTALTIEVGITGAMTVTDASTGECEVMPGLCATDRALEFYLDCVGRQIATALSDPLNSWAEIWRGLSSAIIKIERKRTSDETSGTRIAAHQLVVTVDLLPDPVFGEAIASSSIWARFFAKVEEPAFPNPAYDPDDPDSAPALIIEPALAAKVAMMHLLTGDPASVLNHEVQRRRFGMTLDEARALMDIAVQSAEATEPNIQSVTAERTGESP